MYPCGYMSAMKERYQIAIYAAALFVVETLGTFLYWVARKPNETEATSAQTNISFLTAVVIAAVAGVAGYLWIVRYPMGQALRDAAWGSVLGCVVASLVSPFAGGGYPFNNGPGAFFLKVWLFLGACVLGVLLAGLFAMAIGRDYRDQALKRYAETKAAKPRRVVRR